MGENKCGKWYRVVVDAADRFMTRWHKGEAEKSWVPHETEDAKSGDKGKTGGGSRTDTAVDESRNETVDRVARYRFD